MMNSSFHQHLSSSSQSSRNNSGGMERSRAVQCLADEEADYAMLQDLQLAAELGKTLLERNKELENCIKLNQCTIDDQAQEIEYLKKHTTALKEVNESRLKIYEQLEVSIQDLERANGRLANENANDKKTIKAQTVAIETLEGRIDELQKKLDDTNAKYEAMLRHRHYNNNVNSGNDQGTIDEVDCVGSKASKCDDSIQRTAVSPRRSTLDDDSRLNLTINNNNNNNEDITKILEQLQDARAQRAMEQKRVGELKQRLEAILQEHAQMEEQLNEWKSKAEYIKNLQEEVCTLQEVRQGHLCGRCLRGLDPNGKSGSDSISEVFGVEEEEDEISIAESLAAEGIFDVDSSIHQSLGSKGKENHEIDNPYQVLCEKYDNLIKLQQKHPSQRKGSSNNFNGQQNHPSVLSLQEELQMSGEFSNLSICHSDAEGPISRPSSSNHQQSYNNNSKKKGLPGMCTPTDFSEAETSSSGFSDETSNKATQTENLRPGSFLCTIADGEDRFSIYDDCSNFRSRFQQTPEYRQIFSEIFKVLKRAASAKAEGETLPLLDDSNNSMLATPKAEQKDFSVSIYSEDTPSETTCDDTGSVASLAVSSVVSEPVFRVNTPVVAGRTRENTKQMNENTSIPRKLDLHNTSNKPLHNNSRRQPLEYLQMQVRKKVANKRSRSRRSNADSETPNTPDVVPTCNPRFINANSGRGSSSRRRFRNMSRSEVGDGNLWNGSTIHFYSSNQSSSKGRRFSQNPGLNEIRDSKNNGVEGFKATTASEGIAKLKQLEMSYAEALRLGNRSRRHRKQ